MWEMRNDERGQDAKSLLDRKRGNINHLYPIDAAPGRLTKENRNGLDLSSSGAPKL